MPCTKHIAHYFLVGIIIHCPIKYEKYIFNVLIFTCNSIQKIMHFLLYLASFSHYCSLPNSPICFQLRKINDQQHWESWQISRDITLRHWAGHSLLFCQILYGCSSGFSTATAEHSKLSKWSVHHYLWTSASPNTLDGGSAKKRMYHCELKKYFNFRKRKQLSFCNSVSKTRTNKSLVDGDSLVFPRWYWKCRS